MDLLPAVSKWLRNRARMYRWPRPAEVHGPFYRAVTGLDELHEFFDAGSALFPPGSPAYLEGRCYVCDKAARFVVGRAADGSPVNWRETLECPHCGLNNRFRGSVHLFEELVLPQGYDRVYVTEALTPLYRLLRRRHPGVLGSEFREGVAPGAKFGTPQGRVRNEDVTRLSFGDRSFHAVLSFDVLEHVPDYRAALREFHRVLATGGQLLLSAPFLFDRETRTRARLRADGTVEHLAEPFYHEDPLSPEGTLCFHEFGMDLLDAMRDAGFQESFVVCFNSLEWGYAGAQVMFVGRKRT